MAKRWSDFGMWQEQVDKYLLRLCGVTHDDLPDWDYWNAWNDGVSPGSAARKAMQAAEV